jgi:hypothetical protein
VMSIDGPKFQQHQSKDPKPSDVNRWTLNPKL